MQVGLGVGIGFAEVFDMALKSTQVTVDAAYLQGLDPGSGIAVLDFAPVLPAGAKLFAAVVNVTDAFTGSEGAVGIMQAVLKSSDDAYTYNAFEPTGTTIANAEGETQLATIDFRSWGGKTMRMTFLASGLVDLTNCTGGSLTVTVFYAVFPE